LKITRYGSYNNTFIESNLSNTVNLNATLIVSA